MHDNAPRFLLRGRNASHGPTFHDRGVRKDGATARQRRQDERDAFTAQDADKETAS
jgi:hypothetical protein